MKKSLRGQLALVTGAGRGIGRGCAEALASAGVQVIAVARSRSDLDSLSGHPSGLIEGWPYDVCGDELLDRIGDLETLNILVNNAGANRPQAFVEVDTESLDYVLDLNVRAAFRVAQACVKVMLSRGTRGTIVNMSSQMGHVGSPNRAVYCMSKHAIEGLTKAMAVELAPQGIRVNSVAPTFIETPMTKSMLEKPGFRDFVLDMIPMHRLGTIEDVVAAVIYLVSPGAGLVTGHSLVVDGGWTAR